MDHITEFVYCGRYDSKLLDMFVGR